MRRFTPLVRHRSVVVRLLLGASLAAGLAISTIQAQIPGRNVNMVSGVQWPEGDPFLQRQNEPSVAASTRNPLHLLGGSNDYRTVDVPGLPDGEETGDAWLGLFKSTDGGQRWTSTLLPGYPQDNSPAGQASPLRAKPGVPNSGYQAGADAVVRAGTNGLLYYSGLVFDRAEDGKSAVFLARFIDNNNQESGDPIAYLGTKLVATSNGAKFLDKPWMAVDIPRANAAMCTVTSDNIVPTAQNGRRRRHSYDRHERGFDSSRYRGYRDDDRGRNNGRGNNNRRRRPTPPPPPPPVQKIAAGAVYVAYSSITGDAATLRSEILITRSMDCGNTWSAPMKVSRPEDAVNQGSSITIDPKTGAVYVGWRRFDPDLTDTNDLDAIMVARLPFGATKFETAQRAHKFARPQRKVGRKLHRLFEHRDNRFKDIPSNEAQENLDQFDLGTTGYNFRTNAYPTMTADSTGRVYIAWTQRGYKADPTPATQTTPASNGLKDGARIVIATTKDGKTFTTPEPVDDHLDPGRGHQLMPSMTFAGGKLMLVFYDLRDSKAGTHNRISSDFNTATGLRQTIDIRSAMASPGDEPDFAPSVKVSDYQMGFNPESGEIEELQVNPPNLPMFKQGTVPFIGDYIDVTAAPAFIPGKNGKWEYNHASTGTLPTFHAVWTDNRDVRPPRNGEWWNYAPATKMTPEQPDGKSLFDPTIDVPLCVPGVGNPGSRNQNVYSARITGGLLAGSPGNAKPLSPDLQRGFVVFAQNTTPETKSFRMTILSQPVGGRASFDQFPAPPYVGAVPPPETAIEMIVPPLSTASRTVYVTSSDPDAQLNVDVTELNDLRLMASPALYPTAQRMTGGLAARVILNPDIENPDIENPDIENPDIENPDIENVEVYNPDIENPDIENPDIENPDIENPDIENPDIENPDIENPDIENVRVANPDIENPNILNPDIENPDIENPDIENPDIENGAIADVTWKVSNNGNTTASFNVNLFLAQQQLPTNVKTQLILLKTYRTPVTVRNGCQLGFQVRNILLANIRNPIIVPPGGGTANANDPAETNATLWLAPGEEGRIVLRVIDEDTSNNVPVTKPNGDIEYIDPGMLPSEDISPLVQQQAVNTEDVDDGVIEPPVVPPPAPPATADTVWTTPNTPVRINVLANDAALFGSTKIFSAHPAGLAQNMGGSANELVYMPTTGLIYAGSGRSVGVIDPVSNHLVGRIPTDPTDGAATYGLASPHTGLVFFRMGGSGAPGASLYAFDARPGSPLFNREFPAGPGMMPLIDALGDLHTFALDTTGKVLFYVAGDPGQQKVVALNADPANPATAGQILWGPITLPATGKAWQIVQNPVTGKVYIASTNVGMTGTGGGVYMINPATLAPPLKIAGADQAISLAVNPATNLIFAAGGFSGNYRLNVIDGATDLLLGQTAVVSGGTRTNNAEDRLVVHHATGRVFLRAANQVFIFDGLKGSATFKDVVNPAGIGVAPEFNNSDLVIDQATGLVAVAGNFVFSIAVIDAATDNVTWLPALGRAGGELAIDPATHRLFFADFLSTVHTYNAASPATVTWTAALEIAPETAQVLVNSSTNRAYAASSGAGSTINVISGAGVVTPVAGLTPQAGRWGFGGQLGASFFFTNSGSDTLGGQSRPGSLVRINGLTDTASLPVATIGSPFGFGVNAAANQLIVAGLNGVSPTGAFEAGKIRVHDATNPAIGADADLTGVPLNNPTALPAYGRHVVTNPNTGNTYVMITGGSPRSVLYLPPTTLPTAPAAVTLDLATISGLPLTADDRVEVIRVSATANVIYLGLANAVSGVYRVLALNGATHALVGSYVGGGHGRLHTPSWVAVNNAGDRVYVVNYNNDTVTMLDGSLAFMTTTALPDGPSSTAFNNTLNRLYVGSLDAKSVTALDGTSLAVLSTVKLPLHASFLHVSESDSRLYTAGGNSPDESGFMVLSDVGGQLGSPVSVTSATNGGGTVTVNPEDYSVTYMPGASPGPTDTFTYTALTAAGNSTGTVTVNIVPVVSKPVAINDAFATPQGVTLNIGGRGVLANDAASNTATASQVQGLPGLTLNANGSFSYVPPGVGNFQFTYLAVDGANSNVATVSINVIDPSSPLVVVNTNDSGAGSLRNAINFANGTATADTITFAIPAGPMGPPFVIAPITPLPALNGGTTINGLSQAGAAIGAPNVVISGASMPIDSNGLVLSGNSNVISGLVINHFPSATFSGGNAVLMTGNNNRVEASFVGTAADGSSPAGVRSYTGVRVSGNGNRVGGLNMGMRNVIAGNSQAVWLTAGTGTVIAFNNIGINYLGNAVVPAIAGSPAHGNEFGVLVDGGTGAAIGLAPGLSNVISGNLTGVQLRGGLNTQIAGNHIGLDGLGTFAIPNGDGISAYNTVTGTTIGGVSTGHTNHIAGNGAWGINLDGGGVTNTSVFNNWVGLNPGNNAVPNTAGGIRNNDASGTKIGEPGRRNIISGNADAGFTVGGPGIVVTGFAATAPVIKNNRIGTTSDGLTARPNRFSGVQLQGAATVGGNALSGEGNLISGNGRIATSEGTGIELLPGASGSFIYGNEIGRTAAGGPLGNAYSGITAYGDTDSLEIGGDLPALFNNIATNPGPGIAIYTVGGGALPNEIEILGNRIFNNTGLGIDLNNDGITANDPGDGDDNDDVANYGQNFPVLTSAVNNGSSTSIGVDLSSFAPGETVRIRYFSSGVCGNRSGEDMVAVSDVTQPGTTVVLGVAVPIGRHLTATATDSDGNTSEFSACRQVTAPPPPPAIITSVSPNPSAPGFGQHLYIRGTNLPAVNPSDVILNVTGGGDNTAHNIWHISPTLVVARFVVGTPVTTGTVRVKSPDGSIVSNSFPVTLQATPGAPILTAVATAPGGSGFISSTAMGDTIFVSAENIDTAGYTVVFTPVSPAGAPVEVPSSSTSAGPNGSFSAQAKVPTFMSLASMTVNVQVKTTVNGNTSALSAAHSMTVTSSLNVVGPAGGPGGGTNQGPYYCPAGFPANGVRVATNDTPVNDIWGNVNYDVTAAELMCNNGSSTAKFGGGPTANTALQCAAGELLVGIFGGVDGNVLGSIGPRCQNPLGGSVNQPWGARPAGGTPYTLDCPANKVVVGGQANSGMVLDNLALVCAPKP